MVYNALALPIGIVISEDHFFHSPDGEKYFSRHDQLVVMNILKYTHVILTALMSPRYSQFQVVMRI